jgi:hypothetical protein
MVPEKIMLMSAAGSIMMGFFRWNFGKVQRL